MASTTSMASAMSFNTVVGSPPGMSTRKSVSLVGAPSQRNQSSRRGKRAWRKNANLDDLEEGLEELRSEERLTGIILQKKKDEELFEVDVTGSNEIRKTLPKFSERVLTSTKILAQRSAVPAVFSRSSAFIPTNKDGKRKAVTHDEKSRLLKMGKRLRRGPFDAFVDPNQVGEGSAMLELSEAAKKAGRYDVWAEEAPERIAVKAPQTQHPRSFISVSAVPSPHEGTSYNPPLVSHQDLLRAAHEVEEQKLKGLVELEEMKAKFENARAVASVEEAVGTLAGFASGMTVDSTTEDVEGSDAVEPLPPKKIPGRKTKQQRRKAETLRAEKRALAEKVARRRLLVSVDSAKALRKAISRNFVARERLQAQRHALLEEKLKRGLGGQKIGKYKVPEGEIDVQLGEELSESLRGLKPEGNLFRDRLISMQHRALVEPRGSILTKKHKRKTKEYEKHTYKRFDRGY